MRVNEPQDFVVSSETLERLKEELRELTTTGREEIGARLKHARELGDISENSEYDAAKNSQAMMEARIRQLEYMIRNAVVRESPVEVEAAAPGMIVSVREEGAGETDDYLLTNSVEEKIPGFRTVTIVSPLGKALAGKKVGETAIVEAPGGDFTVEVVGLKTP